MNRIKLLILIGLLLASSVITKAADSVYVTNFLGSTALTRVLISTNRMNIHKIILFSTELTTVKFYNEGRFGVPYWGTNIVNAAYTNILSYSTNISSEIVSETGYTNYMTNAGIFTYTATVAAATNPATPILVLATVPNTSYTYDIGVVSGVASAGVLCERGLTIQALTNINVIIYYDGGGL